MAHTTKVNGTYYEIIGGTTYVNGADYHIVSGNTYINGTIYPILFTVELDPALIAALIDFTYTDNEDGTVTITGWKGTLNGVTSTELVVPDDSRIIL